jgi:UDP:flavonoid glycosyltransferase YjiC (YdhE family)
VRAARRRDVRGAGGDRRVLLVALGTRGDVEPAVRLGSALEQRGDSVVVAVLADGAAAVAEAGLTPLVAGPPAAEAMWWRSPAARQVALRHPGAMYLQIRSRLARQAEGVAAALSPVLVPGAARGHHPWPAPADLVVCGLATAGLVPMLARAGLPARLVLHAPLLPHPRGTSAWRRELTDALPPGVEAGRQALLWSLTQGLSSALGRAQSRRLAGRHPQAHGCGPGVPAPSSAPLLATSRVLDPEPSPEVVQTGWWADPRPVRPLPPSVDAWLVRHPGVVLLSLGSTAQHDPERQVDRLAVVAALSGVPAVVQVDGARLGLRPPRAAGPGAGSDGSGVLVVGDVDHRALLPRLRAVVHHGGSGTTHVAAAAGLPQLVVPHLGDQPHYARQVGRAGLGPPAVPHTRASVPVLAGALADLLHDPAYAREATVAAARMTSEDGLSRALEELATVAPHRASSSRRTP